MTTIKEKEIELPDHLYKTWHALKRFQTGCTAEEMSHITERARAVESAYLNILCVMQVCKKQHRGRKVFFSFVDENKKGEP